MGSTKNTLKIENFFYFYSDEYYCDFQLKDFFFKKNNTFKSFFRNAGVDIPRFFKNTKTIKRDSLEVDSIKFNNYFFRHGKKLKSNKYLIDTLLSMSSKNNIFGTKSKLYWSWKEIFYKNFSLSISCLGNADKFYETVANSPSEDIVNSFGSVQNGKSVSLGQIPPNITTLLTNVYNILPMFSFFIYKVDKTKFKNTKGKVGKFTFIWKYITPYKRHLLVFYWILKELKFQSGRTLKERVLSLFEILVNSPRKTWIWRIKKFSQNYVYFKCRSTLARSYRTTLN